MTARDSNLSARRSTDSAQRVVRHVAERAVDRGMFCGELTESTAEMLAVLSILRWERKLGRAALERIVADCDLLAREFDGAIVEEGRKTRLPNGPQLGMLPSRQKGIVVDANTPLKRVLDQAEQEALGLGHNWVGTEHLLLAAIRSPCPRFQEILGRHGVAYNAARQAVLDLIRQ